jgi:RNA polymerase sigma-70 factor (ECF subfamily)
LSHIIFAMPEPREIVDAIAAAGTARFGPLDTATLAALVDQALADGASGDALRTHAAEVYLAAACATRSAGAIAILEREYIARIPDMLAAKRLPPHAVDDIGQTVRERLLAGDPPYLARAAGRGTLAGLIAVIANRAAIDWLRATARAQRDDREPGDDELVASGDPARDHVRARYAAAIKAAFEAAVSELPPRERTLLRLYLVEQLTIDNIARLYQFHRATAARRIERAREQVATSTRKLLSRTAGITPGELAELSDVVAGQLDLSLSRVLASA